VTRGLAVRRLGPLPQVDVRFDPADLGLVARLTAAATVSPPLEPNTVATAPDGQGHWLWLGPDEWLVVGPEGGNADIAPAVEAALRGAAGDALLTTVDVSANRIALEVAGERASDLLAFGCSLDLDDRAFPSGACAQTNLARAGVVLWRVDDTPTFRLLLRPSYAAYLEAWLDDAAAGLG
jgi:sarcosine oxidase, subunit gamma